MFGIFGKIDYVNCLDQDNSLFLNTDWQWWLLILTVEIFNSQCINGYQYLHWN
jgi:hypothetical protein